MKDLKIVDMLCMGFECFEEMIWSKIKVNEEYKAAQETFSKHIETLKGNHAYMSEVENSATAMEIVARDTAYNEGFKMGIQFMMGCMSKGEVSEYVAR